MDQCIFCKIAAGEIPSSTVYEDEYFKAILDLSPATKGHTIIIPKKHMKDAAELEGEYAKRILPVAAKIGMAMKKGLGCTGFNLVQNNGTKPPGKLKTGWSSRKCPTDTIWITKE